MTLGEGGTGRKAALPRGFLLAWPMPGAGAPCGALRLHAGTGAGQQRTQVPPPQKRKKKIKSRKFSKFPTALGLMWGGRFGGSMGILELSSSDQRQSLALVPSTSSRGQLGTRDTTWDGASCPQCCAHPNWCVPSSHSHRIRPGIPGMLHRAVISPGASVAGCCWSCPSMLWHGCRLPPRLPPRASLLPFSPGHPTAAARARCMSGARALMPGPWAHHAMSSHHGTGTLRPP